VTCSSPGSGVYSVEVRATDTNGFGVESPVLPYTVDSDPVGQLTAERTAVDAGQGVSFSATGGGGTGVYTFAWSGLPSGCEGSTPTISCSPTDAGNYTVQVKLTDSNGATALSPTIVLAVAAPLSVVASAAPSSVSAGQTVAFSVVPSGGTGPFSYSWQFGDGSTGSGSTVDHTYSTGGTYAVLVWANDSAGESVEQTFQVTVSAPAGGPSVLSGAIGIGLAVALIIAVGSIAALWWWRRIPPEDGLSPAESGAGAPPTDSLGPASVEIDDTPPESPPSTLEPS
jgi:PKD repeat protein